MLDTNLSRVNKSQTHQPECYCWQTAPACTSHGEAEGLPGAHKEHNKLFLNKSCLLLYHLNSFSLPALDLVILMGLMKDQRVVSYSEC